MIQEEWSYFIYYFSFQLTEIKRSLGNHGDFDTRCCRVSDILACRSRAFSNTEVFRCSTVAHPMGLQDLEGTPGGFLFFQICANLFKYIQVLILGERHMTHSWMWRLIHNFQRTMGNQRRNLSRPQRTRGNQLLLRDNQKRSLPLQQHQQWKTLIFKYIFDAYSSSRKSSEMKNSPAP